MKVPFAGRKGDTTPPFGSNRNAKVNCWIRCLLLTCRPKLKFGTFTTDDGQRSQNSEQIHIIALGDAREIRRMASAWRGAQSRNGHNLGMELESLTAGMYAVAPLRGA
jgi:hypothetical protein